MAAENSEQFVLLNRLAEEFATRFRRGERPSLGEYIDRHPELADDIREFFPTLVEMEQVQDVRQAPVEQAPSLALTPLDHLGDFRILREIGHGGMGVVYEAEQVSLGRHVALKVLPRQLLANAQTKRRFEREAKAAARLHHTNIVPVFGVGEHEGLPYYVMQFIQGLGLDQVLEELQQLHGGEPGGVSPGRIDKLTGGVLHAARKDVFAAAVARSLMTGRFTLTGEKQEAGPAARIDATATHAPGAAVSAPGADAPGSPSETPLVGRLSDTFSLSSSSAMLPGTGRQSGKKPVTYWQSVARIGVQVADALEYAHRQGILHRDIKPSNLLLDTTGTVWVADFGLAKADDQQNLTHTGDILGTLRYMPPEAFDGKSDARGDIYSLGLTLYELLAFRPAFDEKERNRLIKQVTTVEPARLDRLSREVPRDLVTIIHKAIDRDLAHRYATAAEFEADLKRFLDDEPIQARRQTQLERYVRWARHNPGFAVLGAVLTAVLVLATIASLLAAGYFNRLRLNEAEAAQSERDARYEADNQREVARQQREVAQQHLYYAQMHLAQQAWREHRGLPHMHELLTNWLPQGESPDRRGWEWFYLHSLPHQNLRTFTESGSRGKPSSVAWHIASNRLAAGSSAGLIQIWDVDREQLTLTLSGPAPAGDGWGIRWFGWSPDGGKLAAGFRDATVRVWDTRSGRELSVLGGHQSPIKSVAYSSDGQRLAAWGHDGTIKIWDATTNRLTADILQVGSVCAGAWSPDDKLLASGHEDGTVTISESRASGKIVTLRGHVSRIHGLEWSPDGTRMASSSQDHTARIWDVASAKLVLGPLRHGHEVTAVAWEPGGQRLATGCVDQSVKIWNATTGREELTLRGHRESVTSLAWSPDGRLASGCDDGSVRIWSSIRDQESILVPGHVARATSVTWSPDGRRLASGGDDGKIRIWDPVTRREVLTLKGHEGPVMPLFGLIRTLAWSPDGTRLASGALDGTARVWETAGGREVFALPADHGAVWSVAWSPDGTYLAAGSEDGTIRVLEGLEHPPKVHLFKAHQGRTRALAWNAQGDRLASAGVDGLVKLWDPKHGTELVRMQGHQFPWIHAVAWSPDGKRLASAGADHLVMVWDAESGQKLATMHGHNDWVDAVVWSPDGTRLASAGIDNTVRIWDPRTGEEALVLRGNTGMFHDVSWHPDGAQLAAASSDGQVWVWDATLGFERDTTPRALPFLDRKVASGTARGEDFRWAAESYLRAGRRAQAFQLQKAAVLLELSEARKTSPRDSPQLAGALAQCGQRLLQLQAFADAEPLLRECLDMREQTQPDAWTTFLTMSSLGGALLGQMQYAEAEPLLLRGYEGMKQRGKTIPPAEQVRLTEAADRLVQLYDALGKTDEAATWRRVVETPPPPADYLARGEASARLGHWHEAAGDLARVAQAYSTDVRYRIFLANLLLQMDDVQGYRQLCDDKAKELNQLPFDPTVANNTVWLFCLSPGAALEYESLVSLAERAVKQPQNEPQRLLTLNTLGVILFRAGRYPEAIDRLNERVAAGAAPGAPVDWVFLAMAHHHLGHKAEATRWLEKFRAYNVPDLRTSRDLWNDLEIALFRREVEALLREEAGKQK